MHNYLNKGKFIFHSTDDNKHKVISFVSENEIKKQKPFFLKLDSLEIK